MVESENYPLAARNTKRKNKNSTTRRFSDEQIRSLESLFKLEAKLEPRKKLQMAKELDLQPRQVAIWFQNKRARWKSKQIEQEYRSLKADYDDLHSRFEFLKKENQSLLIQYKKLSNQQNKQPSDGSRSVTVSKDLDGNSTDSGSENGGTNFELKGKNSCSLIRGGLMDHDMVMYSDDEEIRRDRNTTGYLAQIIEESEFDDRADHGFSEPREKLSRIDSDGLFDQLCGTSNWWDFWT